MGAKCCRGHGEVDSVQDSVATLADFEVQASDPAEMRVVETGDGAGPSEQRPLSPTLKPSELENHLETSNTRESPRNLGQDGMSLGYTASDILWSTGSFSDPIPNGFYSVIPDKRLKLCKSMPTLDEIQALGDKRLMDDVILIDFEKDLKFSRLKDYTITLVTGLDSKPVTVIKKIAGLLADLYKRPQSPAKTAKSIESRGFPLLGQIKRGSCRSRAIYFKALADHVGLKSTLVMGFPSNLRTPASVVDSYNHMSVVVVLNTVEMLVDLMRCPGQLIPFSAKAIYMAHISAAGQTNFDPPLESNVPMHGCMDRIHNASPSQSEPNTATASGQRKLTKEQSTASSSCKSDGATKLETKGRMRIPEISDDIARAVLLVMQIQFLKERGDDDSSPHIPDNQNISGFHLNSRDQVPGGRVTVDPQEAISLLSSPQNYQSQSHERSGPSNQNKSHIRNELLESPMFQDKPLLPYKEWNIDFSELTVGSRIGNGSFGIVFHGMWNGTDVAIKMLLEKQLTAENMEDFCNEMSIHSRIRHPNACTKPQLSVVTEYMERGSLYEMLHIEKMELKWKRKLKMLRDICRGLMCIHRMGVIHCDLKSANCLLTKTGFVKICDFGLSRMMKGKTVKDTVAAGTPEWMAPELIRNEPISEKCDIFSFGVVMWELCTLSKPWKGVPRKKVIHTVANEGARLQIPKGPLSTLIADCWLEPDKRPSCKEILNRLMICELEL